MIPSHHTWESLSLIPTSPQEEAGTGQGSSNEKKDGKGRRQRGEKAKRIRQALSSWLAVWEMGLINRKALRLKCTGLSQTRGRKKRNQSTRPTASSRFPLNPRVSLWDPCSHIAVPWAGSREGTTRESQTLKHLINTYWLSISYMSGYCSKHWGGGVGVSVSQQTKIQALMMLSF